MKIRQTFKGPVNNVYNIEGDLILSAESQAPDLVRALADLCTEIAALTALDPSTREEVESKLKAAKKEGKAPRPSGAAIKRHLDDAGKILEGATGVAQQVGKLAKTVYDIGAWAVNLFD